MHLASLIFFILENQEVFRNYVPAALLFSLKHPVGEYELLCEIAFTEDYYHRQMVFSLPAVMDYTFTRAAVTHFILKIKSQSTCKKIVFQPDVTQSEAKRRQLLGS